MAARKLPTAAARNRKTVKANKPAAAKRNAKPATQQPARAQNVTLAKSKALIRRELQRKRNPLTHDEIAAKLGVPRTRVYWVNRALREAS